MRATPDLPWTVEQPDGLTADPAISPPPRLQRPNDLAPAATLRTPGTVLVRLDGHHEVAAPPLPPETHC